MQARMISVREKICAAENYQPAVAAIDLHFLRAANLRDYLPVAGDAALPAGGRFLDGAAKIRLLAGGKYLRGLIVHQGEF